MHDIKKGDRVHLRSAKTGKTLTGTVVDIVAGLFGEALTAVRITDGKELIVDPKSLWRD